MIKRFIAIIIVLCKLDVETRWNSQYDMLDSVLNKRGPIAAAYSRLRVENPLVPAIVDDAEHVREYLKPALLFTQDMSGQKYVTASLVVYLITSLLSSKMNPEMRKPWAKVKADVGLKVNVPKWLMDGHKAFVAYALDFWADEGAGVLNPILFEAAFLDPRTSHLAWLEPSEQKKVHNGMFSYSINFLL